ncbi:MAG: thioredoxin domain-containing protein [Actinomycetota bacterium]
MNRLADETSPYLRQHRDNPVHWWPWCDEAFDEARERDVPVLVSIGYSACHWCHVMAHESFEDDEVAAKLNHGFVAIKVDREERPEIDQIYMDALQAITGRGGWPLTMFVTPNGEPFFGGTYYPKDRFLEVLDAIAQGYSERRDDINENIDRIHEKIDSASTLKSADDIPTIEQMNTAVKGLARAHDAEWGGFGIPPKFPTVFNVQLMMRAFMSSGSEPAKDIVVRTLDAMCSGGMYDHIGGGFARYSTDRQWNVPHFEKMLNDQALLVQTYLQCLMVLRPPQWRQVVQETVEYVVRTLRHPDGGFYSAEDADSIGPDGEPVEGRFYTWTEDEVRAALHDVKPEFIEETLSWWGIGESRAKTTTHLKRTPNPAFDNTKPPTDGTEQAGENDRFLIERTEAKLGEFEGRWIPNRAAHRGELVRSDPMNFTRARLFQARLERQRPALDDKVLLEWNALFLSALSQAAAVFDHEPWLDAAVANAEFLLRELRGEDGRWFRSWHADGEPKARHQALAADHATLIDAFIRLGEATGAARWLGEAQAVADTLLDHFFDAGSGGLFTTADDAETLVVRQKDVIDNATPSANSMAAHALTRLAALTGEQRYLNHADRILQVLTDVVDTGVGQYSHALTATDLRRRGVTELVIPVEPNDEGVREKTPMVRLAQSVFRPDIVLAWGESHDTPLWQGKEPGMAYLCRQGTCDAPTADVEAFAEQLFGRKVRVVDPDDPANVDPDDPANVDRTDATSGEQDADGATTDPDE